MDEKEEFLDQFQLKLKQNLKKWKQEKSKRDGQAGLPGLAVQLPFTLGDYVLISVLGQGGMGTVYEALQVRMEKKVAVKILSVHRMADAESQERFAREIMAYGKLRHQNIIQALDAREEDGVYFLVMEYGDGADLEELTEYINPFRISDVCEMIRQASMGLQHAYEKCRYSFGFVFAGLYPVLFADPETSLWR